MNPWIIALWIYIAGIAVYFLLFYFQNKFQAGKGNKKLIIQTGTDQASAPPETRALNHMKYSLIWPILLVLVIILVTSDLTLGTNHIIKELSNKKKDK